MSLADADDNHDGDCDGDRNRGCCEGYGYILASSS